MADTEKGKTKVTKEKKPPKPRKIQRELHKKIIHAKRVEDTQRKRHDDKNPDGIFIQIC